MKIWIDDVRPAPDGYVWCQTVKEAKGIVILQEERVRWCRDIHKAISLGYFKHESAEAWKKQAEEVIIELIDIDHDAGDYAHDGGDYIKLLDWLEETGRSYPIRIHSMNPVGVENMRRIIRGNGWTEVE